LRRSSATAEAQGFKEVLIHHVGAGGDDGVDHVVADHVHDDLFQARADQRPGQAEDHAAFLVAQHAVINLGRPVQVAGAVGHVFHGLDQRDDAGHFGHIHVLDGAELQEFPLVGRIGRLQGLGVECLVVCHGKTSKYECPVDTKKVTSIRYGVPEKSIFGYPPLRVGVAFDGWHCHAKGGSVKSWLN
jgi:hypothetical protein